MFKNRYSTGEGLSDVSNGIFALASSIQIGLKSVGGGLTALAESITTFAAALEHIALNMAEHSDERR